MPYETIQTRVERSAFVIELHRPDRRNAVSERMMDEIIHLHATIKPIETTWVAPFLGHDNGFGILLTHGRLTLMAASASDIRKTALALDLASEVNYVPAS